jgi:hypothetical protein
MRWRRLRYSWPKSHSAFKRGRAPAAAVGGLSASVLQKLNEGIPSHLCNSAINTRQPVCVAATNCRVAGNASQFAKWVAVHRLAPRCSPGRRCGACCRNRGSPQQPVGRHTRQRRVTRCKNGREPKKVSFVSSPSAGTQKTQETRQSLHQLWAPAHLQGELLVQALVIIAVRVDGLAVRDLVVPVEAGQQGCS